MEWVLEYSQSIKYLLNSWTSLGLRTDGHGSNGVRRYSQYGSVSEEG